MSQAILAEDGAEGLFLRGLSTKLLTNGISAMLFTILWKYFEELLSKKVWSCAHMHVHGHAHDPVVDRLVGWLIADSLSRLSALVLLFPLLEQEAKKEAKKQA